MPASPRNARVEAAATQSESNAKKPAGRLPTGRQAGATKGEGADIDSVGSGVLFAVALDELF
jgi:hypothetical protein